MVSERTEFLISQFVDGTIAADDRAVLEAELDESADARLLVAEYQKLNQVLAAQPVPEIDHVALTRRINNVLDEYEAVPSYRMPFAWSTIAPAVALAACVVIAAGLWLRPTGQDSARQTVATTAGNPGVIQVAVLQPEDAKLEIGPALQRIEVGPPANQPYSHVLSEAIVTRPNTLFIAKADRPAQDTPQSLY